MSSEYSSLAMRPHTVRRTFQTTARAARTRARVTQASAGLRPHVDAVAIDPMAIGGNALRHCAVDQAEPGFETHWTRILHCDLFARHDARGAHGSPIDRSMSPTQTRAATKFPGETLALRSIVTAHASSAARHSSAGNDPTCQEIRTPVVVPGVRQWSTGNEATCDDPSARAIERRARNALATMRVGSATPDDGVLAGSAAAFGATSRTPGLASVARRVRGVIAAFAAFNRAILARRRRRLQARAICQTLRACDDRTLRDLGLHRSEIMSLAAEATGMAACTRERIHRLRRGPR
jgi:uncharacterized protein YjiS (DUF1127 family)